MRHSRHAAEAALERHPLLRAAAAGVVAAAAGLDVARSRYWPSVELAEEASRSTNPAVVFSSKLGQKRFGASDFALDALNRPDPFGHFSTRLALRQSVWDGGRRHLALRAAAVGLVASERALARARQEVAFGAVRAFWDALLADESLRAAEDAEREAEANARPARERVEAGEAIPSDSLQAEARLGAVSGLRARAEGAVAVSRAALRRALGLSADAHLALAEVEARACPAGDVESWQAEAIGRRPDLAALRLGEEQARLGVGIAKGGRFPVLDVSAGAEWNGRALSGRMATTGRSARACGFRSSTGSTRGRVPRGRAPSRTLSGRAWRRRRTRCGSR